MTPLHHAGDLVRELFALVPLWLARALFVALPLFLLVWVLRLPRAATVPLDRPARWDENLKLWAAIALGLQIVIYLVF
jgi:hypothetical protein